MKRLRGGGGGAQVIGADLANVSEDPEEFVRQYGNMSIDLEKKVPPPPASDRFGSDRLFCRHAPTPGRLSPFLRCFTTDSLTAWRSRWLSETVL